MKTYSAARLLAVILPLLSTACSGGGGGGGSAAAISAVNSRVAVADSFGGIADGVDAVTVTVTVMDDRNKPVAGRRVALAVTGVGGFVTQPGGKTDGAGQIAASLTATIPGAMTVVATVDPNGAAVEIDQRASSEFIRIEANSRFVRISGSDTDTGASPRQAWRTIGFALTQLAAGDTLYVGAGTYAEVLELNTSGTARLPITVHGDATGLFTGDAGEVIVDAQGATHAVRVSNASHIVIRGMTLTGAVRAAGIGAGVHITANSSDVHIVENRIFGNECGVSIIDATRVWLESNSVSNNAGSPGDGIELVRATNARIAHNLIYNNERYGIRLVEGASGVDITLNTLYRNGGDQVHEAGSGSSGTLTNCVITEGFADGVRLVAGTAISETNNLIWGHAGADFADGGGPPIDSADPMFVDPAGSDGLLGGLEGRDDIFLFDATSPVFDSGNATASATQLFFGGALSGHTSRPDGVLEGVGTDGVLVNLGLHLRAQSVPMEALDEGDGRAVFVESDGVQVRGRRRSTNGWSTEGRSDPMNTNVRWLVNQTSPADAGEELVAALTDDGVSTELFVRRWNGRRWIADNPFHPIDSAIRSENSGQRGFDLEFEGLSGDALLVRSNDDNNPLFRTYSAGTWSDDAPVFAAPVGSGTILWIELTRKQGSDEIALVCLDDQENLTALIWTGSAWESGAPVVLGTQMATVTENKAFDVAYETLSGDLLVVWGHTIVIEETRHAERDANTGVWTIGQHFSTDASGVVVRLAADPTSDRILAGVAEGTAGDDTVGMIWDGGAWTHTAELDISSNTNQRDLAVGWVGDTSRAVLIYSDDDGGGTLDWGIWTTGGWKRGEDVALPGVGDFAFAETMTLVDEGLMLALMVDDAGNLFSLTYDGIDWTIEDGGAALASGINVSGTTKAFGVARRN